MSHAQVSQKRNAALDEKFYFRRSIMTKTQAACGPEPPAAEDDVALMSLNDIINGQGGGGGGFVGLLPLIELYLNTINIDAASRCTLCRYLSLIAGRAAGTLSTTASFIRGFVAEHPAYKHGGVRTVCGGFSFVARLFPWLLDSVVSEEINFDLVAHLDKLAKGEVVAPSLLGDCCVPAAAAAAKK